MAGTIVASTLSDGTNSTSTTNCISGSAKAWVNFDGTGTVSTNQTIRASYNVSSIFKNGTGDYTINFTNAFADTNYSVACIPTVPADQGSSYQVGIRVASGGNPSSAPTLMSTTQLRILSRRDVDYDLFTGCISVFR